MKSFTAFIAGVGFILSSIVFGMSAPANATGDDCVPTKDTYSQWQNVGDVIRTEENVAPGEDTDLVRYLPAGTVEEQVQTGTETVVVGTQHYSLKGNSGIEKDEVPPTPSENPDIWQANTEQEPHDNNPNVTWYDEEGVGLHYTSHGSSGNRDWFYFEVITEEQPVYETDTDYLWQKQVREVIPGEDCPEAPLELVVKAVPVDACGTENDAWAKAYNDELVDVSESEVEGVSYVKFTVKPEFADEYVIKGQTEFTFTFTNEPCEEEPPTGCPDDREPPRMCNPTEPPTEPKEPNKNVSITDTKAPQASVPTSVDAGLTAAPAGSQNGPLAAMLAGLALITMAGARKVVTVRNR